MMRLYGGDCNHNLLYDNNTEIHDAVNGGNHRREYEFTSVKSSISYICPNDNKSSSVPTMYVHAYLAVFVESNPFVGEELTLDIRASESISCTYGAVDKDHSMTGYYIRFGISVQRITDDPGVSRPSSH